MKRNTIVACVLTLILTIIVHWRWLGQGIITYGDWWFTFPFATAYYFPHTYLWTSLMNLGSINISSSIYPLLYIIGLLAHWGISFSITERVTFIYPCIILAPITSFFLIRKVTHSNTASVIGSFVYAFNVYFLIISGGQFTLLAGAAILPLALLLFMLMLEKQKVYFAILTGLCLAVLGIYEFRILYMTIWVLFFYWLYFVFIMQSDFRIKTLIKYCLFAAVPIVLCMVLNTYWLIPLAHSGQITSNVVVDRGLFGNGYLTITDAISLFHPFWTGAQPSAFVVESMPLYFWLFPIFAFTGAFLLRKQKLILFFAFIAILGIFLTKQVDTPFPDIYIFLYNHLPGFNAFREASKFYTLVALGYSVLIGGCIAWILQNRKMLNGNIYIKYGKYLAIILIALAALYNTKPLITGAFKETFDTRTIPSDYTIAANFIEKQHTYFRTLWVPTFSRWSYDDGLHPELGANQEINTDWQQFDLYKNIYPDTDFEIAKLLQQSYMSSILDASQVKYLFVPLEDQDDIFDNLDQFSTRKYIIEQLNSLPYLKRIDIGTKQLVVYENMGFTPNSYIGNDNTGNMLVQSFPYNASVMPPFWDNKTGACTSAMMQNFNITTSCYYITFQLRQMPTMF